MRLFRRHYYELTVFGAKTVEFQTELFSLKICFDLDILLTRNFTGNLDQFYCPICRHELKIQDGAYLFMKRIEEKTQNGHIIISKTQYDLCCRHISNGSLCTTYILCHFKSVKVTLNYSYSNFNRILRNRFMMEQNR